MMADRYTLLKDISNLKCARNYSQLFYSYANGAKRQREGGQEWRGGEGAESLNNFYSVSC